MMGLE